MYNAKMEELGKKRSVIREIFEYSKKREAEIGPGKVFDFSIGNPSVPAPDCVNETAVRLIKECDSVELHGYTSAQGDAGVRKAVADYVNRTCGASLTPDCIYMTCGAAASLSVCIKALAEEGDEFIVFTPFFPEYRVFTEAAGGTLVTVDSLPDTFQPDIEALDRAIGPRTKALILNSPNNPSGAVINEESVKRVCGLLRRRSAELGRPVFIISDEPYRELVYDKETVVPYIPNEYDNTFVCYSFSKSMSLPGERIGYVAVSPKMKDFADAYAAVCGAGRALGYVCAPSLFQRVTAKCLGAVSDTSVYRRNRDLLYGELTRMGYSCVYPDGAFYLFMKTPEPDAAAFCERAKKYELLLVPSDDFGRPGYVRIAYCVETEKIRAALPAFEALVKEYK